MILVRVGAPLWLSVIVISWGFVATLFAGLKTANEFYILRFLLGVAECGTFPGECSCSARLAEVLSLQGIKRSESQHCLLMFRYVVLLVHVLL